MTSKLDYGKKKQASNEVIVIDEDTEDEDDVDVVAVVKSKAVGSGTKEVRVASRVTDVASGINEIDAEPVKEKSTKKGEEDISEKASTPKCDACHIWKKKCDGKFPCSACIQYYMKEHKIKNIEMVPMEKIDCVYNLEKLRGRAPKGSVVKDSDANIDDPLFMTDAWLDVGKECENADGKRIVEHESALLTVDGESYPINKGDCVCVWNDAQGEKVGDSTPDKKIWQSDWIAKVESMWEETETQEKMFRARWFLKRSDIENIGDSNAFAGDITREILLSVLTQKDLVLTSETDDNSLDTISKLANIIFQPPKSTRSGTLMKDEFDYFLHNYTEDQLPYRCQFLLQYTNENDQEYYVVEPYGAETETDSDKNTGKDDDEVAKVDDDLNANETREKRKMTAEDNEDIEAIHRKKKRVRQNEEKIHTKSKNSNYRDSNVSRESASDEVTTMDTGGMVQHSERRRSGRIRISTSEGKASDEGTTMDTGGKMQHGERRRSGRIRISTSGDDEEENNNNSNNDTDSMSRQENEEKDENELLEVTFNNNTIREINQEEEEADTNELVTLLRELQGQSQLCSVDIIWIPNREDEFILNAIEMELAWLIEEGMYCLLPSKLRRLMRIVLDDDEFRDGDENEDELKKNNIQWHFVWKYASPTLKAHLRKSLLGPFPSTLDKENGADDQDLIISMIRSEDKMVKQRFRTYRSFIQVALGRGFRRDIMRPVIAMLRLFHRNKIESNSEENTETDTIQTTAVEFPQPAIEAAWKYALQINKERNRKKKKKSR